MASILLSSAWHESQGESGHLVYWYTRQVYHLTNEPVRALASLLEAILDWALERRRLLVLDDFIVHVDDVTSTQAMDLVLSMVALRLSQYRKPPLMEMGVRFDLHCRS